MAEQSEKDPLTTKQRLFVEHYLGRANGNASEAARLAGYAVRQSGHEVLSNPVIAAEISRRVKEAAMGADEVLCRLADHARVSLADFVDLQDDGTWKVNLKRAEAAGKLHLLAELGCTEHGPKLKLVDSQAALVQLGRHHKLFTDKSEQEQSGQVVVKIEYADHDPGDYDQPAEAAPGTAAGAPGSEPV